MTLFDPDQPRARPTDPHTSHDAAASVSQVRESQIAVLTCLRLVGPCTDESLVEGYQRRYRQMGWPRQKESGIRTRRNELWRGKLVNDTGIRERLESGRRAIVWEARA